jgi:hypothetical protein
MTTPAITRGDVVAIRRIEPGEPWPPTYGLHQLGPKGFVPVPLPVSEETADRFGRRAAANGGMPR